MAEFTPADIRKEAELAGATRLATNPGFKGKNMMTDRVIGYYAFDTFRVELTSGSFLGNPLIGFTVLGDSDCKLSGVAHTLEGLRDAFARLETEVYNPTSAN